MRRWSAGVLIAAITLGCVALSYFTLGHFYGKGQTVTSSRTVILENYGQNASIEGTEYAVENVEYISDQDIYLISLRRVLLGSYVGAPVPLTVSSEIYAEATQTEGPLIVSETATSETEPISVLPISAIIGVAVGSIAIGIWISRQKLWGNAMSTLLEHGLKDMTVRDIEIVGQIMKLEEFTLPQLMRQASASRATTWRTVRKLIRQGLVQQTDKTSPAANGRGGRGKPSRVYRYLGPKEVKS